MDFPFESDINSLRTPCYLVSEKALKHNMEILLSVRKRTGCKILLAQKAFSMYAAYPMMRPYIDGTTASGLFEAKLGHEEFGGETHVFSPAYKKEDMAELVKICDDIIFNSFSQWKLHRGTVKNSGRKVSCGIRCNPLYSEIDTDIYNPCFTGSRLGVTPENFESGELDGIEGLHFHTMCEQGADVLARTIPHIEEHFGEYIKQMKWVNLGGGHHITKAGYDIDLLCRTVNSIQQKYGVQVYLEPGEACALNAGYLAARVLDVVQNGDVQIAILDTSAACHMPDVLEMPYRPPLYNGMDAEHTPYVYRLGGPTCLAGDVIGDYGFPVPLQEGDLLLFGDMAIYTTCKNNTFNGMPLPAIYVRKADGQLQPLAQFGYNDFRQRLGKRK